MTDDLYPEHNRRSGDDGMPWQVKAAFFFGAPTVFCGYLIWALVSGIVPMMLSMQQTMSALVVSVGSVTSEHSAQKIQNDRIIQILQASCANAAKGSDERERCFR